MAIIAIILSIVVIIISWLIHLKYSQQRVLQIWQNLGVAHQRPSFLFGNNQDVIKGKLSPHEFQLKIYQYFKGERISVIFEGKRPVILILDPNLIKSILVSNFEHFVDRPGLIFREKSYLKKMLISLRGEQWKKTRQSMTPAFTLHKLKDMFDIIIKCSDEMVHLIDKQLDSNGNGELEMKSILGRFTLEVISSCAFGLNITEINEEEGPINTDSFFKMAKTFLENSYFDKFIIYSVLMIAPSLAPAIPASFVNRKALAFLRNVCLFVKKAREENPDLRRNDFFQMMLDKVDKPNENEDYVMDEDAMIAQSLLFIMAGYETSSTTLALACYQLALNPRYQDIARQEVETYFENNDQLSFGDINQFTYVEQVISETLRLHPPMSRLDRICTKAFELDGTPVVVQPGMRVRIPVFGLHMDEEYFPDPEHFDPERFSNNNKTKMNPYTYLPFGKGQRHCIGLTFAMVTTKICLAHLLKNYQFSVCDKTDVPFRYNTRSMLLKAANGVWLSVKKL